MRESNIGREGGRESLCVCACERESEGGRKVGKKRARERLRGRECSSEGGGRECDWSSDR